MIEQQFGSRQHFSPHGHFSLVQHDGFIEVEATGPGNIEVIQDYHFSMRNLAKAYAGNPWATYLKLDGLPLMPPDATELLIQGMMIANQNAHRGTAVILLGQCNTHICKSYWEAIFARSKTPCLFCNSQEEAATFISSLLTA